MKKEQEYLLPWDRPGWFDQVTRWIEAQFIIHGRQRTGPIEIIHQRAWSAFARVPTNHGLVYCKTPSPMNIFEAGLTEFLFRHRPDCSVRLLAIDREQGWILSADSGVTLRSQGRTVAQIEHWLKLLPFFAEFQIEMVTYVPDILALGIPDRRLNHLPAQYAQLLADTDALRVGREPGLTIADYRRMQEMQAEFTAMCAELAGYRLPETLAHEEVHENNVLVNNDGNYIFTDWSDSIVGHPFFSMTVTINSIVHWLKLPHDTHIVAQLRDAYLEPWTRFLTRKQLLAAFKLAYRLGMVNRALSWRHNLHTLAEKDKVAYIDSVPGWIYDFLNAGTTIPYLGNI